MPTGNNRPFSAHGAAQTIRKKQYEDRERAGMNGSSYTEKKKLPPAHKSPSNVVTPTIGGTIKKGIRAATIFADNIGLDGKKGFQNSFNSIKGMGKKK